MAGPRRRSAATRAAYYAQGTTPTPTPTTDQPIDGETRWVDTGFGFAERQIYDADTGRWIGLGDTANIDRPSGGYSLQLCWTTGWVAGSAAAT